MLGASPEELLAPAALHLWGENQTKVDLLLACIDKLRAFDDETLQDVFSLLNRLGKSGRGAFEEDEWTWRNVNLGGLTGG